MLIILACVCRCLHRTMLSTVQNCAVYRPFASTLNHTTGVCHSQSPAMQHLLKHQTKQALKIEHRTQKFATPPSGVRHPSVNRRNDLSVIVNGCINARREGNAQRPAVDSCGRESDLLRSVTLIKRLRSAEGWGQGHVLTRPIQSRLALYLLDRCVQRHPAEDGKGFG